MTEHFYVGSYWGARKETALECARRAALFFRGLEHCDPSFTQWYRGGPKYPRGSPGHLVQTDEKALEELLAKSRNRRDIDKTVIEDLGFSQIMWNANGNATNISLACGGYFPSAMTNRCLLSPPKQGAAHQRILTLPVLTEIILCIARVWEPDFAMVSSSEMVEVIEKRSGEVRVGWLTYLPRSLGALPPLPAPVRIEPVGEQGWLLVLSQEPMSASNPEHVAFTARIRELLDRAGLIARPEPDPTDV